MVAVLGLCLWGCAHHEPAGSREVGMGDRKSVNQSELQEDLERFTGVLMDRVAQATAPLLSAASPEVRTEALRRTLLYQASALDIATGPNPEVNLLDMLAFVMLARTSLEEHWIPEVLGARGKPLAEAFARLEQDLWQIADKVMAPAQKEQLRQVVRDWRRDNPEQTRVEAVRLFSFSEIAGEIATERARQARGLLSTVRTATQSADQALLLAERAMFLAQRMPFLLRLQTRLGAQEVLSDGLVMMGQAEALIEQTSNLRPLLGEASTLAERSQQALKEARQLVEALQPLLAVRADGQAETGLERLVSSADRLVGETHALMRRVEGLAQVLSSASRLTERSLTLVQEVRGLLPEGEGDPLALAAGRLDGLVRRWLIYFGLVGVLLITLFWAGYAVARRLTGGG